MNASRKKIASWIILATLIVTGLLILAFPAPRHVLVGWAAGEPFSFGLPLSHYQYLVENGEVPERNGALLDLAVATTGKGDVRNEEAPFAGHRQEVIASLSKALTDDPVPSVRLAAANAMAIVTSAWHEDADSAIPALRRCIRQQSATIADICVSALGKIGPRAAAAVPDLVSYFLSERSDSYGASFSDQAIVATGEKAVPELISVLESADSHKEIRRRGYTAQTWTTYLLANIAEKVGTKAQSAVSALKDLLRSDNPSVRREASRALAGIGPAGTEAIPELVALFRPDSQSGEYQNDFETYRSAADALAQMGPSAAPYLPELRTLAEDRSHRGHYSLWRAIAGISGTVTAQRDWSIADVGRSLVSAVAFNAASSLLASTHGSDGAIRIYQVDSGRLSRELEGHTGPVVDLAFSPVGDILASGALDGTVRLWDAKTGDQIAQFPVDRRTFDLAFDPQGRLLAVCDTGPRVRLWDIATGQEAGSISGFTGIARSLSYSPDGTLIAIGEDLRDIGETSSVTLWKLSTRRLARTLQPKVNGTVRTLAFSSDSKHLAAAAYDGVHIWGLEDESHHFTPTRSKYDRVTGLAFAPGDQMLLIVTNDETDTGEWTLWNIAAKRYEFRALLTGNPHCMSLSPDGKWLGIGGSSLSLWLLAFNSRYTRHIDVFGFR